MYKKTILLGVNKIDGIIATMDIKVRDDLKFSASFNIGQLTEVNYNNYSYYVDYFDCLDAETKLDYLSNGDKTREEVIQNWINDETDYRDRIDCSCTDYEIEYEVNTYNFETIACGQSDIDEYNIKLINENVTKRLLDMWKEYHLKVINIHQFIDLIEDIEKMHDYDSDNVDLSEVLEEIFF